MIKTSIIIGTLNHLDDCLKPCCESIIKFTDLSDKEVIIVANGCTDGTREYVESLGPAFKLIWFDEPMGYSRANNAGIESARGEYIVLLNNDTILLEQYKDNWIHILMKPFEEDSSVGITCPSMIWSSPANAMFAVFFCVMIKREVFYKVGLLNTIYGVGGGEDTEFCIEANRHGYKTLQVPGETHNAGEFMVGNFPIYHRGESTVNDNPEWNKIFERNSQILRDKYNNANHQ